MFQSYCSKCRKTVPVQLLVSDNDLELALDNNTEIKVKHTVSGDDHVWILSDQDLDNLINRQRTTPIWYAKCPNFPDHWLLFHNSTHEQLSAQCLLCGPNFMVNIGKTKKGYVRVSERDAGFTIREPKPGEAKGQSESQAT
jgi:hypothetical protein